MVRPADEALLGRTIAGKFHVEAFLGSGAMGAVYRARQIALDKAIALKVMHADLARDPSFATRFQREAKAASRLDHPNSVRVIDFGVEPDGLCDADRSTSGKIGLNVRKPSCTTMIVV